MMSISKNTKRINLETIRAIRRMKKFSRGDRKGLHFINNCKMFLLIITTKEALPPWTQFSPETTLSTLEQFLLLCKIKTKILERLVR